jgi:hypothetical protein
MSCMSCISCMSYTLTLSPPPYTHSAYLRERNKAGICKHEEQSLYVLPPPKGAELIRCVLMSNRPAAAARPMQQQQQQGQAAQQFKRKAPQPAQPSGGGKAAAQPSLLASLSSRASAGGEARVANQANRLAKQAATSYIDKMEADLHFRLEAFREQVRTCCAGGAGSWVVLCTACVYVMCI